MRARRSLLICLFLVVGTLAAYWPVRHAQFLNFDDPFYVTNNPKVFHGLTREGLGWAWTTFHACNWHPLTWLSHMLDCQLFGENPCGHHLVNVGLHIGNALLLLAFLRRATGAFWRSALVAALFAWHPVHVESVVWVAERKDVLSTLFGLLALIAYGEYARSEKGRPEAKHSRRWYLLSLFLFALGLLSKPMLVTLPFVMMLLDYWPLKRFESAVKCSESGSGFREWEFGLGNLRCFWPLLREKVPFFMLTTVSCVITFLAQKSGGAVVAVEKVPLLNRTTNALLSYVAYLGKTFWPTKLSAYYAYAPEMLLGKVVLCGLVLTGISIVALLAARRAPYFLTGWLWFVGTLVPVIGLVQVGSQAMADRYTYIPSIGLFMLAAWGIAEAAERRRSAKYALVCLSAMVLVACAVRTYYQTGHWQNSVALFTHAVRVTQNNPVAEHNLGHALSLAGNQAAALEHFDKCPRLWPGYPSALLNRANALSLAGKFEEAILGYQKAIEAQTNYEQAYYGLGCALAVLLKLDEAKTNFLKALRCKPDYAQAHTKLGNLLMLQGATNEAMLHLQEAVKIWPDYEEGQYHLGGALARQKEFREAAAAFGAAIKRRPDYEMALNDLAWMLATQPDPQLRNVPDAVRYARRACELTHYTDPMYLDTLGVALSEAGQLPEAINLMEKAEGLATASGNWALSAQFRARLATYRSGQSYTQGLTTR